MSTPERLQILITGLVQGVGMRPHVWRLAQQLKLTGKVQNTAAGVLIEIQGEYSHDFLPQLTDTLPPLARIDTINTTKLAVLPHEHDFKIIASETERAYAMIAPDTGICRDCLHELFDPYSRYYLYPFLNCSNCGPRFTITRQLPYDRGFTAMAAFPLCPACQNDYLDPGNRRYHAEPSACAECGPRLSHPIHEIAEAFLNGKIIALKGVGGYQLLCDARNVQALLSLRQRKNRPAKPFALLTLNSRSAAHLVMLSPSARDLLESRARPIVLLKKTDQTLPPAIAPGLAHLGIMLPASPLHYLLFHALAGYPPGHAWLEQTQTVVMIATSANCGGNPLIIDDGCARNELSAIADLVVSYNRDIVTRADDSVAQIINNAPAFIRRARGYAPLAIKLPYSMPSTLALGGHLKNTFCITRADEAFVSQHIGSLSNKSSIDFLHESLQHWQSFLGVALERIACDQHPDFYTSRLAHSFNLPVTPVQHHHAHMAAVAAEYHITAPVLGLALDGYGYGADHEAWGGELLLFDCRHCQRLGSLLPLPQPGNEAAARAPWRMAASVLHLLGMNKQITKRFPEQAHAGHIAALLQTQNKMHLPHSTSCGRLFDAASALLGVNTLSSYEGQAARQLESLVTDLEVLPNGWYVEHGQLNFLPLFAVLLQLDAVTGANLFHGTLIAGLADWVTATAKQMSLQTIVLGGGCFLNQILAAGLTDALAKQGISALLPRQLPPNDGGLSLGQAFIAASKES